MHDRSERPDPVFQAFRPFLWAFLPPILLNAIFILQPWFDRWLIYVDPLLAAQMAEKCCNRSFGFASNIGVLYWAAAASTCALAAAVLWHSRAPWPRVRMLALGAMFIGFLCLDDLFMLHENVFPRLGVPEMLVMGSYGVLAVGYLVMNWRMVLEAEPVLFVTSLGFLALSLAVDVDGNDAQDLWKLLLEEGAKLMGIAGWCVWHIRQAYALLRGEVGVVQA